VKIMHRDVAVRRIPGRTRLAVALAFACAGAAAAPFLAPVSDSAALSPHYAMHMSQRAARNAAWTVPDTRYRVPPHPRGDTLPVTSCADDGSPGTLRAVIAAAGEGDVVDLSALDCSTITLTQGIIDLSVLGDHHVNDLSIVGPGTDALTIDGNGDRVFSHGDYQLGLGTLSISDVTIANGNYTHGLASCIDSSGEVELTRTVVTGCTASGGGPLTFGGAISAGYLTMTSSTISNSSSSAAGDNVAIGGAAYVTGDATLIDSTITGNTVSAETPGDGTYYLTAGGGLYVRGALSMATSTISNNTLATNDMLTGPGGGIFVRADTDIAGSTFEWNIAPSGGALSKAVFSHYGDPGTTLAITNSTFGVNGASDVGGAIETFRPTTIASSTISSNGAGLGGGGLVCRGEDVTLELESTIIAMNAYSDVVGLYSDIFCEQPVTIAGNNNLVIATTNATLPADTILADPMLALPADNGGPTRTMAPDPESPAIDRGNNLAGLEFDQRGEGFPRVAGAGPDIGAFETEGAIVDAIFADGFD
jgi:hypothetical protein